MIKTKISAKTVQEPLFHVVKRDSMPWWKALIIRLGAIVIALIVCGIISAIVIKANPFSVYAEMVNGVFGTERRIWIFLRNTALLLGVALAVVPAFKMKFWNLGANGQVLIGCLATTACMQCLGGKLPDGVVILFMVVSSILSGIIWAVLPAIFKAFFKTNESLFTLMMNYIAVGLVSYFINIWVKSGSGVLNPISYANLPDLGNKYLLTIVVVAVLTVLMHVYLKYSKHGYEITVVGESENTARYVGINVKKVIIRTLVVSGAVCGIIGLLLSGAINHTVSADMVDNRGFTAIMAAWLAKFNPLVMVLTSLFIVFLDQGVSQVNTKFRLGNDAFSDIVIGIIYFFIIGCEFFISYKLKFRSGKKEEKK